MSKLFESAALFSTKSRRWAADLIASGAHTPQSLILHFQTRDLYNYLNLQSDSGTTWIGSTERWQSVHTSLRYVHPDATGSGHSGATDLLAYQSMEQGNYWNIRSGIKHSSLTVELPKPIASRNRDDCFYADDRTYRNLLSLERFSHKSHYSVYNHSNLHLKCIPTFRRNWATEPSYVDWKQQRITMRRQKNLSCTVPH